jgi:lysine-specific demethylase 8
VPSIHSVPWPASAAEFALLVSKSEPLLFPSVAVDWPCSRLWSMPYLRARLEGRQIDVTASGSPLHQADPEKGHYTSDQTVSLTFGEFLDRISTPEPPGTYYYLHKKSIDQHLPELQGDIRIPEFISDSAFMLASLWMGPRGSITPIHHDFTNNLFVQVRGRKRVILYPPDPEHAFYRLPFRDIDGRSSWHISHVGSGTSPRKESFPLFRDAIPIDIVVEQGSMLFIPSFYWHEVHSLDTPSISLSYWWDERPLPEIEASISAITAFFQLHRDVPQSWKALIQRLVTSHIVRPAS